MLKKALPKGTDGVNAQYVFRTVRPADYSTPYDTMLKHGVQFTAVERQQNMFITVTVSLLGIHDCRCSLCSAASKGSLRVQPRITLSLMVWMLGKRVC